MYKRLNLKYSILIILSLILLGYLLKEISTDNYKNECLTTNSSEKLMICMYRQEKTNLLTPDEQYQMFIRQIANKDDSQFYTGLQLAYDYCLQNDHKCINFDKNVLKNFSKKCLLKSKDINNICASDFFKNIIVNEESIQIYNNIFKESILNRKYENNLCTSEILNFFNKLSSQQKGQLDRSIIKECSI